MNSKAKQQQKPQQLDIKIQQVQQQYSCCDAKLFKIPQTQKWVFTLCLINIPLILHQILHIQWFSHNHYFGAIYVLLIAHCINFWTYMNLCVQDPGFIQKIKYGYQIDQQFINIPKSQNMNSYVAVSYILVNKQMVSRVKFCTTCNIYRPNRASHCNQCGVCIERMDHHCPWIGTCVGKRNQKYFYIFLVSLFVLIITTIVMCLMIMVGTKEDPQNFGDRLKIYPMTIVLVILPCTPGLFFVGIMAFFHTYLIATDLTTKQVIDEKWSSSVGNPQRKQNCLKNLIKSLIKPQQSKSKYKHQAFPYYNNQIQNSSNTNNPKNSKNSDSQKSSKNKNQIKSQSQQSIHKQKFPDKPNIQEKVMDNQIEIQTHEKINV